MRRGGKAKGVVIASEFLCCDPRHYETRRRHSQMVAIAKRVIQAQGEVAPTTAENLRKVFAARVVEAKEAKERDQEVIV